MRLALRTLVPPRFLLAMTLVAPILVAGTSAYADKCNGAKIKAIGKKESGLLGCSAKEATKAVTGCEATVSGKFSTAYNKPTGCTPAAPSETQCESTADGCQSAIRALLPDGSGANPNKCEATRLKAAGKLASGELGCISKAAAKGVPVDTVGCIPKATGKFTTAFNKVSGCTGDGHASNIQSDVENDCVNNMVDVSGGNFVAITCGSAATTTTSSSSSTSTTTTTTVTTGSTSTTSSTSATTTTPSTPTTSSTSTTTSSTTTTSVLMLSCLSDRNCEGYATLPNQYDPCNARSCNGATCTAPVVAADNTPCDDSRNCSFAYPSSGGCPSNKCVGGTNAGAACTSDSVCPGGTCFMNRCLGGPVPDTQCNTNGDCIGTGTNGSCVKGTLNHVSVTTCDGGLEAGNHCKLVCVGGAFAGLPCLVDSDCFDGTSGACPNIAPSSDCPPAGHCVRWSDAGDGSCAAIQSNPFCNTVADCPTTRYCALDPTNLQSGYSLCVNNANGDPAPTTADNCCSGGVSLGPCLVYDICDTVNHVCRRTSQGNLTTTSCGGSLFIYGESGCSGGLTGAGGIVGKTCTSDSDCQGAKCVSGRCVSACNNVCQAGQCTSASSANCP